MRILHVIGAMDRGGAETMIMNLYRSMDRTQVQFDFLVHEQRVCDYDEEIESLGGRVFRCLPRFTGANYLRYRRLCQDFFREHEEHPIVHGHIASSSALYLSVAKRFGRITIAHSHAQNYPLSLPELGFRVVTYPTRFVADQFLACSLEAGRDRFGNAVVRGDSFHVVKNAIDVDAYACDALEHVQAKRALGYEGSVLIGHVGRFDPVKNHPFLIEVFAQIAQRVPSAKLILVGRGSGEAVTRQLVHERGLDGQVVFFGVTDHVPDVLKALDVFVFPSFSEGLSMAAVEAQAAGIPCVLSTGIPELAVVSPSLAQRLSLEEGVAMWANSVLEALGATVDRSSGAEAARACGYDVSLTAHWLGEYYDDLARG